MRGESGKWKGESGKVKGGEVVVDVEKDIGKK